MVGRKRKQGKRYPSGKLNNTLSPEQVVELRKDIASSMPHRRHLPADKRHLELAESPLGSLHLIGAISKDQFDAGFRYRKIVAKYRSSMAAPNPNAAAIDLTGTRGGGNVVELTKPEETQLWATYDAAFRAITTRWGKLVVNSVVIHDRPLQAGDLPWLTKALDELVSHFGLKSGQQRARSA